VCWNLGIRAKEIKQIGEKINKSVLLRVAFLNSGRSSGRPSGPATAAGKEVDFEIVLWYVTNQGCLSSSMNVEG